jgi:HprK-related kinase A
MNLQMALGWRRHLLLHASSVEKDGRALVMTGESGSGKSTLAAQLGERGWRLMGDEFALLDLVSGAVFPFPRLVSLKNGAISVIAAEAPDKRMGPLLGGTAKGDIRHLVPRADAVGRMGEGAQPALLLFPRFGHGADVRPVGQGEVFMRLTQASTNYVALGEAGFGAHSLASYRAFRRGRSIFLPGMRRSPWSNGFGRSLHERGGAGARFAGACNGGQAGCDGVECADRGGAGGTVDWNAGREGR